MEKKYHYKAKDYSSKLELMEANNLTSTRFDSLFKMGRIQMTTNDDMVDFSGLYLGHRDSNQKSDELNMRKEDNDE